MKYVDWFVEATRQRDRRAAEKSKTFEVVVIAINFSPIEIVRRINEVSRSN